jgi:hypothetical protein
MLIQYFDIPELQLVALHPQHLLPYGKILLRRNSNGYSAYKASSDGHLQQVDPVSILSLDPPAPDAAPFPPLYP